MDTETGRIYAPGEADAAGRIVPVSDRVAKLMSDAQAAERKRKRKAAKNARRRNR